MKLQLRIVLRGSAAVAVVAAATFLSLAVSANAVTAGFIYLLAILWLSVWQGFIAGAIGSVLATGAFNYFFFAPVGTLEIDDPENWISLVCFLIAATVASRLVVRERERAAEAEARQREITALYELCLDLFTAGGKPGGLDAATSRALRTIGAQGGGLVLPDDGEGGDARLIGRPKDLEVHQLLDRSGATAAAAADDTGAPAAGWRNVRIPVPIEGRPSGALIAYGTRADQATLESVARLVGLALERERLLREQAKLGALAASESLKSSILRAVSHDLTTPITAILLSLDALRRETASGSGGRHAVEQVIEETSRLSRRVQNLLSLARLEAAGAGPRREPTPPADLFRAARENLGPIAAHRRFDARVAEECPDLDVDPSLALEIVVNLIENADRASPPSEPIEMVAAPHPTDPSRVRLEILDRGRGLPPAPPADGDVEGLPGKGLGLEIARSFAAAHGGVLTLTAREGGGARARVDLPAAHVAGTSSGGRT